MYLNIVFRTLGSYFLSRKLTASSRNVFMLIDPPDLHVEVLVLFVLDQRPLGLQLERRLPLARVEDGVHLGGDVDGGLGLRLLDHPGDHVRGHMPCGSPPWLASSRRAS